ncbi:hypothetical protein S2M10_34890 [Sphingomonas sp. S2M10]|uniref:hypothetical protein n=1 Tax=Sphingomonas sp. S2M10 TaxID=2705010 RepID=UPI0014574AA0|nr:hypothetical protein [Sphingomonas sp. S2M10]NLS28479.1 hypothetical protein [Sphingomonas sp. S2M10]
MARPLRLVLVSIALTGAAAGQAQQAGGRIGGTPPPAPCVVVDIAGTRVGHLDCATQALEAAARAAQARARQAIVTPVLDAGSPDVRTGIASQSATRQRMGNAFGVSVHAQRPARRP